MNLNHGLRAKARLLLECKEMALPVSFHDEIESLEMIISLAKTNGWQYCGNGSQSDQIIEDIIERIRSYVQNKNELLN